MIKYWQRQLERRSIFLNLLPFLIIYVVLVALFHRDIMENDEARYVMYAKNLCDGFYSPQNEVYLWNGPGYPIFLMPFILFKTPWIICTLANAILMYVALVFVYKTLKYDFSDMKSFLYASSVGLFYPIWQEIPNIKTETFTIFLLSGFLFGVRSMLVNKRIKTKLFTAFMLGFICLTKIIFGYVLLLVIFFSILYYFFTAKTFLLQVSTLAFVVTLPYLVYTYNKTGKIFYWGNSGGEVLYFASSPFPNEFGDWCDVDAIMSGEEMIPSQKGFYQNHEQIWKEIYKEKNGIQRNDLFISYALQNIKNHPLKYAKNTFTNFFRMVFGFPFSYTPQKQQTVIRIPSGIVGVLSLVLTLLYALKRSFWRNDFLYTIFVVTFFYLSISLLVSAYPRHFFVVFPLLVSLSAHINIKIQTRSSI